MPRVKSGVAHHARKKKIMQAAKGARDAGLLQVAERCQGEAAGQLSWLRTRMKQAAPQALVVAD